MIKYSDGTEARVGDRVSLNHGTDTGVVLHVLDSIENARTWNLEESGLMINQISSGLTFWPGHSLDADEVRFVERE